jgi:NAD(P)-dependent dehydrogenase (short-subunit alcohol dehydrogenase family)
LACAGIIEKGKWFDPELTIETVEKEETKLTLEVNLWGTCMFARIAVVYLKHAKKEGEDKSLTLISSAAGFRESPGLWMYQVQATSSPWCIITFSFQRYIAEWAPAYLNSVPSMALWALCARFAR